MVSDCKRIVKPDSEIVLGVADLKCEEAWEKVLKNLSLNKIPLLKIDSEGRNIETGPVITDPLPGEPYQKMEEKYRIEVKCLKPLFTEIRCYIKVRGFTPDNKWIEIKDTVKYEKRFTDSFNFTQ